jgi:hypothetical protein
MNPFRCLAVVGLMASLAVGAGASGAQPAKPHHHGVHGVVEVVHHKHHTFTVRVHHARTAKTAAHHTDRKFHVNHDTVFVLDGKHHTHVSFAALHHGEHVVVHTAAGHPHLATRVEIHRQHTQVARR